MGHPIRIIVGETTLAAELNEGSRAREILDLLPIKASANRWGDEIYFPIPLQRQADSQARAEFEVGELGYWPTGNAFCIFFGPTPVSRGEEPVMADPGDPIGRVLDDVECLKDVSGGTTVRIEKAE